MVAPIYLEESQLKNLSGEGDASTGHFGRAMGKDFTDSEGDGLVLPGLQKKEYTMAN